MRERLIELISKVQYMGGLEEKLADYLIAEGVVAPPVKIGRTCYKVWKKEIIELKIVSITYEPTPAYSYWVSFDKIGELCLMQDGSKNENHSWEDVFLTKEEAKKALAERSKK